MHNPLLLIMIALVFFVVRVLQPGSRGIDQSEIRRRMQMHGVSVESIASLSFYIPAPKDWIRFWSDRYASPSRVYRIVGVDTDGHRRQVDVLINPSVTYEPQILKSRNIG